MASRAMCLDHVVLEVRNAEISVEFYRALLGLKPVRLNEFRRGTARFPSSRIAGDTVIDLFPRAMWSDKKRARNPNHICLATTRRRALTIRRRLARAGIGIERESKRNFGARGWGVSYYFRDPDRVTVEVRFYAAQF
jgi:glyoxylase I family protein